MHRKLVFLAFIGILLVGCGTSKKSSSKSEKSTIAETLTQKNRPNFSLRDQIRQLPGVVIRNGVPVFNKTPGAFTQTTLYEPLYVLDGHVVGNSFSQLDLLVRNIDVDKIEVLDTSDAALYGSRAANGVIKITTLK